MECHVCSLPLQKDIKKEFSNAGAENRTYPCTKSQGANNTNDFRSAVTVRQTSFFVLLNPCSNNISLFRSFKNDTDLCMGQNPNYPGQTFQNKQTMLPNLWTEKLFARSAQGLYNIVRYFEMIGQTER